MITYVILSEVKVSNVSPRYCMSHRPGARCDNPETFSQFIFAHSEGPKKPVKV